MAQISVTAFVNNILEFLRTAVIPFLFVLATVIFIWGVIQYVIGGQGGNDAKVEAGKKVMIWGIIGLAIMTSAWAIVGILCNSLLVWAGTGKCPGP